MQQGALTEAIDGKFNSGQWIGTVTMENATVKVMLNIESRLPGVAQFLSHVPHSPSIRTSAYWQIKESEREVVLCSPNIQFFEEATGNLIPAEEIWKLKQIKEPMPQEIRYKLDQQGRIVR